MGFRISETQNFEDQITAELKPTCSMLESCLKKSGAVRSISCARFSCWTIIYVKRPGTTKNGRISTDAGKSNTDIASTKSKSAIKKKITSIAKTLLASVKIAPLSKNSCNLDKYFSGTILSIINAKSSIILNFIK